jgi:phosphoribosylformylglycinamidine (FGAM) synthase-like enzyme
MWQFAQAVEGIGEACRALGVPITGGNVSLYNETDGRAIYPTPVIGVVGVLEHADRVLTRRFQGTGEVILLLGDGRGELGGSEYLKVAHGLVQGTPPALDLAAERALQDLMVALATERLLRSAHDCSDGGLAVALAECCFDTAGAGAEVSIEGVTPAGQPGPDADATSALSQAAALFGESASRVVARVIGETGGNRLRIAVAGTTVVDLPVEEAERVWCTAIEQVFARRVA